MDNLDVFELDSDTKIATTVGELHRLYFIGCNEQREADMLISQGKDTSEVDNRPVIIKGDIV